MRRPSSVAVLLAAQAVAWAGFASVLPVLPLYLHARGLPLPWLGWLVAVYSLASLAAQLVMGRWSDRVGRRRVLVGGLWLAAAGTAAFAGQWPGAGYLAFRAVWGFGAGAVSVAGMASIPDLVPPARQGRAYGWMVAAQMGGLAGGPLLGSVLATAFGTTGMFFGGAALAGLAGAVAAWGLPAGSQRPMLSPSLRPEPVWRRRRRLLLANAAWVGLLGVYDTGWSVYLHRLGASQFDVSLSWTLFSLPLLLMSLVAGRVAERAAWRRPAVVGGVLLNAVLAAGYGVVPTVWAAVGLSVVESSAMAMIGPSFNAWLMDGVAPHERGAVQGGAQAAGTVGSMALALATGYLLPLSVRWPFFLGAALLAAAGLVLAGGARRPAAERA